MRDTVLRTLSAACKLVVALSGIDGVPDDGNQAGTFTAQVISGVGEAFNNVAQHAYRTDAAGAVRFTMEMGPGCITVRMEDFGQSFDPALVPAPDLENLPERGLGVFIIKSFMDEVTYAPGTPNAFTLVKRLKPAQS
jgi:serine/threonine-protein kinase RsbW